MEKYSRFCRVCCEPFKSESYFVMKTTGQLTKLGEAMEKVTDLKLNEERGVPQLCRTCYRKVMALKKAADDMELRKSDLRSKLSSSGNFSYCQNEQKES